MRPSHAKFQLYGFFLIRHLLIRHLPIELLLYGFLLITLILIGQLLIRHLPIEPLTYVPFISSRFYRESSFILLWYCAMYLPRMSNSMFTTVPSLILWKLVTSKV